jgi:hypothetical protein
MEQREERRLKRPEGTREGIKMGVSSLVQDVDEGVKGKI